MRVRIRGLNKRTLKVREVVRHLKNSGWRPTRQSGSHQIWESADGTKSVSLPRTQGNNDVTAAVLMILRQVLPMEDRMKSKPEVISTFPLSSPDSTLCTYAKLSPARQERALKRAKIIEIVALSYERPLAHLRSTLREEHELPVGDDMLQAIVRGVKKLNGVDMEAPQSEYVKKAIRDFGLSRAEAEILNLDLSPVDVIQLSSSCFDRKCRLAGVDIEKAKSAPVQTAKSSTTPPIKIVLPQAEPEAVVLPLQSTTPEPPLAQLLGWMRTNSVTRITIADTAEAVEVDVVRRKATPTKITYR